MDPRRLITAIHHWLLKVKDALLSYAGITAICLIIYSAAITYYFFICATVKMDWIEFIWFKDKWRNAILGLGSATVFIFYIIGVKNDLQKQFLWVFCGSITCTYGIVMAVYFHWMEQPYEYLLVLDGATFFVTLFILILAVKHKLLE